MDYPKFAQTFTVGFLKLLSTHPIHIVVWGNFPFNYSEIVLYMYSVHCTLGLRNLTLQNKQSINQSNKQTNKQTNKTNKQTNKQTNNKQTLDSEDLSNNEFFMVM